MNYTDIVCDNNSNTPNTPTTYASNSPTNFTSAEGRFAVNFPQGEVEQSSQAIPLKNGGITIVHQFSVELDKNKVNYTVAYSDYPVNYANGDPQVVIAGTRNGFARTEAFDGHSNQLERHSRTRVYGERPQLELRDAAVPARQAALPVDCGLE